MAQSLHWVWQMSNKSNVNQVKIKMISICTKLAKCNAVQVRACAFMLYQALCIIKIAPKAGQLKAERIRTQLVHRDTSQQINWTKESAYNYQLTQWSIWQCISRNKPNPLNAFGQQLPFIWPVANTTNCSPTNQNRNRNRYRNRLNTKCNYHQHLHLYA